MTEDDFTGAIQELELLRTRVQELTSRKNEVLRQLENAHENVRLQAAKVDALRRRRRMEVTK